MVEGKDFKDPMIFDPWLTAKGVTQVRDIIVRIYTVWTAPYHVEAVWGPCQDRDPILRHISKGAC